MNKLAFRLLGLAASVLGGMLASAIFKRLWKVTAGEEEDPEPA
jgi:hypothetical protein